MDAVVGSQLKGAWLTDIDDTLIDSGAFPGRRALAAIEAFVRRLAERGIIWVGMSGVSLAKIRGRLLDNITQTLGAPIFYYSGDGSQKYFFAPDTGEWIEDRSFARTLSDAQASAIIGPNRLEGELIGNGIAAEEAGRRARRASEALTRWSAGAQESVPPGNRSNSGSSILDVLEEKLAFYGFAPREAALYYRGGSISWMILGDHSAESYREPKAARARSALIRLARRELGARRNLCRLGEPVVVPFPGARGIKFVLEGNSKLRAVRDLMKTTGLPPRQIVFAGNEIHRGGNDNMLRAVKGMTLLSVGEHLDLGSTDVVDGRLVFEERSRSDLSAGQSATRRRSDGRPHCAGVEAMQVWMTWVSERLEEGVEWAVLLSSIRSGDRPSSKRI